MSRRYVQQMSDGDTVEEVYLITDKQLRANRNGNLYLQVELRDRTGSISARLWNAGIRHVVFEGDSPNTAQLAIIAAELRLPNAGPRASPVSRPAGEKHHTA